MPVSAPFVREYFGTKNVGTIFGLIFALPTIAMVVAPPLAGWVFDTRGVYDPTWLILSSASAIGAFLLLAMPLPPKRSRGLST